jgi:transcriptional repressor NrdR
MADMNVPYQVRCAPGAQPCLGFRIGHIQEYEKGDEKFRKKYRFLTVVACLQIQILNLFIGFMGQNGTNIMTCPFCGHREDKVIDSRESKEGDSVRRRRQCLACERRFTTYERCDEIPRMVIKKDGRREHFDRQKVLSGLLRACEKRPVSMGKLAELVNEVESDLLESSEGEISTTSIGEKLMERLRNLDKIAYVRFASVYRDFQDLEEFLSELKNTMLSRKV